MNYEESLSYLLSLGHETLTIKLGLRNTELLLQSLGHPQESYQSVQIAGTNGKGSTAVILDSICRAAGMKTGLFTSPHLISITERIVIGGHEISTHDFARHTNTVRIVAEELLSQGRLDALPTFFEQVTATALLAFKEADVAMAILETGLGGRLDATTVASAATVAITPLALDHQEYLGETLAEIAAEKAAIIRPGVNAIIAPQPPPALEVILQRCRECLVTPQIVSERQASIHSTTSDGRFRVTLETSEARYENILVGLRGRHQILNASVALELAESLSQQGFDIPTAAIVEGIQTANHPGRLELLDNSPPLLLDGAHNPSGAQALRSYLEEFASGRLTLIFGAMKDKKLEEISAILFPLADRLILTRVDNPRSAEVSDLRQLASGLLSDEKIAATSSVSEALALAKETTPSNGLICVTGSLYLLGATKKELADR
ncbi:MAG: folylpolyglutamate synthase/dihydrofolate synthase family protein [Acidobacteriota bacterium]